MAHGPRVAPDSPAAERLDYGQVVLERWLRDTLDVLKAGLPVGARCDAFRSLTRPEGSSLDARNGALHRMLVNSIEIERRETEG